jgi:hypothetical protein
MASQLLTVSLLFSGTWGSLFRGAGLADLASGLGPELLSREFAPPPLLSLSALFFSLLPERNAHQDFSSQIRHN